MDEKIIIQTPGEYIIRAGDAIPIQNQENFNIEGTIGSVQEWLSKKDIDVKKSHVVYSYEHQYIKLNINEQDPFGKVTVAGRLQINPFLESLSINAGRKFSPQDLAQKLKMSRFYFAESIQCFTLVSSLEKFRVSVQQEIENSNDFKGNKKALFEQNIRQSHDLSFVLKTNIFKGQKERSFKVEINFDVRDKAIEMWLESVELKELIDTETARIIDAEIAVISGTPNLVIIEK